MLLAATFSFAGCSIDDTYDLDKDFDLTMGLGSQGLQIKLGSTEKIRLSSLLDLSESVQTDKEQRYYLTESGHTQVAFSVDNASFSIDNVNLKTTHELINYDMLLEQYPQFDGRPIPVTPAFQDDLDNFEGNHDYNFDVKNIGEEVVQLNTVRPEAGNQVKFAFSLVQPAGSAFKIKELKGLKITFPDYITLEGATVQGNAIVENNPRIVNGRVELTPALIKSVNFKGDKGVVDPITHRLDLTGDIKMTGTISLYADSNFEFAPGQNVQAQLSVLVGNGRPGSQSSLVVESVNGRFNPAINPAPESINISASLPDFLKDEKVAVKVLNPTIKFTADMRDIPAAVNVSAEVAPLFKGTENAEKTVDLPIATLFKLQGNTVYYCATDRPYDVDEVSPNATVKGGVAGLPGLLEKIPDEMRFGIPRRARRQDAPRRPPQLHPLLLRLPCLRRGEPSGAEPQEPHRPIHPQNPLRIC